MIFFLWGWNHSEYIHSKQLSPYYDRKIVVDEYYMNNYCDQICKKLETRECNWQHCPINCLLGDYGPWSDCDPCVEKQVGHPWASSGNPNHNERLGKLGRNAQFLQFLKINNPSFHWGKIPFSNFLLLLLGVGGRGLNYMFYYHMSSKRSSERSSESKSRC